ncbi:MAG: hypothetical protein RLZZ613_1067 [Pseudomonadota bacterium]
MSKLLTDNLWVCFYIDKLALLIAQQNPSLVIKENLSLCPRESKAERPQAALAIHEHGLVYQANQQALDAGVSPGLGKASALSRCPQLLWFPRDLNAETQYLQEQCWWLSRFTPNLCIEDGFLLAEVSRSLKLFGGLEALVEQMSEGFSQVQRSLKLAIAPTARAAIWLSKWQANRNSNQVKKSAVFQNITIILDSSQLRQALEGIDINCLSTHTETAQQSQQLHMMREDLGLFKLKSLWDLPRKSLRQRLGARALLAMDQALGLEADPRIWLQIPENLNRLGKRQFRKTTGRSCNVHSVCYSILFSSWLGLMTISFELHHRDRGPVSVIKLGTQTLCDQSKRWSGLWEEHIAKTVLRDPVVGISLCGGATQNMPLASERLFPGPNVVRQTQTALFERLQARLGRSSMFRMLTIAEHRPEMAQRLCELNCQADYNDHKLNSAKLVSVMIDQPSMGLPRPLWFFEEPIPLIERSKRPYWHGPLALVAGPERIETAWWEGQWFARDYFIASDQRHVLYWIYRNRQHDPASTSLQWFIQGCFG